MVAVGMFTTANCLRKQFSVTILIFFPFHSACLTFYSLQKCPVDYSAFKYNFIL